MMSVMRTGPVHPGPGIYRVGAPGLPVSPSLTGEGHQLLMVTTLAANTQETVFQAAALQAIGELLLHVLGKEPIFGGKLSQKPGVMLFYELIEKC